jgi:hypothetical protein
MKQPPSHAPALQTSPVPHVVPSATSLHIVVTVVLIAGSHARQALPGFAMPDA